VPDTFGSNSVCELELIARLGVGHQSRHFPHYVSLSTPGIRNLFTSALSTNSSPKAVRRGDATLPLDGFISPKTGCASIV
jgi:hypothetical protein